MGNNDGTFNSGRSRLGVDATGGLVLRGISGTPTLFDRLDTNSTYYTFIDSGAFTMEFANATNMDFNGIQLASNCVVSLASSTFDNLGFGGATNAYLRLEGLASNATFYNVNFPMSRSAGSSVKANVRVEGTDTNLFWKIASGTGALWGENFDDDTNNKIQWNTVPDTGVRYWVGAAAGVWNSTANWSLMSGGPGGEQVPLSTHTVVFDGGSLSSATVNTNVTISSLTIAGFSARSTPAATTLRCQAMSPSLAAILP